MNKTPIQELKEQLVEEDIRCLSIDSYLQKEKQFAFECFEAGCAYILSEHAYLKQTHPNFDQFYSQYAERKS
jgi:hypothetical protein